MLTISKEAPRRGNEMSAQGIAPPWVADYSHIRAL